MERLEEELRVVRQRFGDDVQNFWKSIHMVCIQKIFPKILRDHLAVQASSIDSFEKQRHVVSDDRRVPASERAWVRSDAHGCRRHCQDQGRQERRHRERQGRQVRWQLCLVWRVWSHDCQKKAAGKTAGSQVPSRTRSEAKGKGGKGKKGASSLDEWPDGQENPPSGAKAPEEAAGLFVGAVSRHERYSQRDWQALERIQKQSRDQLKSHRSANLCANAVAAELGDRIESPQKCKFDD